MIPWSNFFHMNLFFDSTNGRVSSKTHVYMLKPTISWVICQVKKRLFSFKYTSDFATHLCLQCAGDKISAHYMMSLGKDFWRFENYAVTEVDIITGKCAY